MLRELAEALEVLTAEVPLVLVLEDLQWSDHATVEALAYLAQHRAPLYAWFTEGFDTPDLQEAKTLLVAVDSAGV
jgi:predicted ATPase